MLVERLSQMIFCECTFARLIYCSDDFALGSVGNLVFVKPVKSEFNCGMNLLFQ